MNDAVIATEGLTKTYVSGTNEVHALRGIDLTIGRGELVAIMGTSGSGKSTLMNLLGCLDTPTTGTYTLDGLRVDNLGRNELAAIRNQKIGFIFQGFNLLPRTTALENVELPMLYDRRPATGDRKRDTRAMATKALERVGLGGRPITSRTSSPAGSSSAWPSPAPSSPSRPWCSPTNRPAISTRARPSK